MPNEKNKSSMELENKIRCVLMDFEINEITLQEATKRILLLLGVVGQSEQLLAFGWYIMEHSNVNDGKTAKDYLQDFLSQ